jgi:hypothetical protein
MFENFEKHNTSQQKKPKLCSEHNLLVVVIGHLAKVPLAGEARRRSLMNMFHIYSTCEFHCNVPPCTVLWSARDFGQRTMVTAFLGVPPVGRPKDT